ncbi:solute carrier family 28 member 3 isoform X1 [Colletes gigas]|uniref:solute carrier family 28 member 3 isoform X1 n=1 Tax=Colletes gigas TaxID=935657 RepID=UPI001C9B834F|nr:solute carrier family 28 member 3 isoform X1 [Colletes gigas]
MHRKMSGTVNSAFEDSELNVLETGRWIDESTKDKETRTKNESINCLAAGYNTLNNFLLKHSRICKLVLLALSNALVLIYFVIATLYWRNHNIEKGLNWCNGYGMLILLLVVGYGGVLYSSILKRILRKILVRCSQPFRHLVKSLQRTKYGNVACQTVIYACIFGAIIVFLIFDTTDSRERLVSAIGIVILISFGWIFSKHPSHIKWRPVLCGLILQFVFGLITIRWVVGQAIFQCISEKVTTFLNFAKSGASFIFSEQLVNDGIFAFATLPVIFYFSFFIQILYYLGVMQSIILNLGQALQRLMGTSICESVICAANIFIGMTESPLLIKPYLNKLTTSELHTIMCSGFGSVSGTVLAAYIGFGANPAHLITASLMAAPASLCYSKLFYPETEKSPISHDDIKLEKSDDASFMDAASKGALAGIPLVMGIIANIVAFVSFIALLNALLSWLGMLVGFDGLTFEFILSKTFMPLSWIMGVPWDKCEEVGTLIGLKTVVNEFVAYQKLGEYKRQKKIFGRTEAIATYAICGFANPGSIGITLGGLSTLAPDRKEQISSAVLRAFIAGSAVNFLTASIAGMLIADPPFDAVNATMALNMSVANGSCNSC